MNKTRSRSDPDTPEFTELDPEGPIEVTEFRSRNGCLFATLERKSGATARARPTEMAPGADHLITATGYTGVEMDPQVAPANRVIEELYGAINLIDEPVYNEYTARVAMFVEAIWGRKAREDFDQINEDGRPHMSFATSTELHGQEPIPEPEYIEWGVWKAVDNLNNVDDLEYDISIPEAAEDFSLPQDLSVMSREHVSDSGLADQTVHHAEAIVNESGRVLAER